MKGIKRVLAVLLSFAMIMGLAAVTGSNQVEAAKKKAKAKKVKVTKVKVNAPYAKKAYVAKGKSIKLSANVTVRPNKKANKKVKFVSKNKKVATVTSKGVVKAKKTGTAKIVVSSKKNNKKKTTVTVKVVKNPVKKVTLNKKNTSLDAGGTLTLKAKVSAKKGASKRIYWKSSKPSVATVSQKGVVMAKKAGGTTITALATDGSKKKATCKVTVSNAVNMTGMDVLNRQSVSFSLDKAYGLSAANISVMVKSTPNGTYRKQMKIDNISSADSKNYTVVLNNKTRIWDNEYVQVSIPSLPGNVKSMEKQYTEPLTAYTADQVSLWTVDNYDKVSFSFGGDGYAQYSISGLPAGLVSEVEGGYLYVKGTPTIAGVAAATMNAVDELGNTLTKTIYFVVGSKTQLAGAACPEYTLVATGDSNNVYAEVDVAGGSGSYQYSIVADPQGTGIKVDSEDGELSGKIVAPGDYTVIVRAVDENNPGLFTDIGVVIHVAQGVTIAGIVKDANGNPIPYADVDFENKNKADRYSSSSSTYADKNGAYSAVLSPSSYDVEASYHSWNKYSDNAKATIYLYDQDIRATRSGFDLSLPLYKVALVSNDNSVNVGTADWYWNHESLGSGSSLYLKAGTYTIESDEVSSATTSSGDWFNGRQSVVTKLKLSASFTVANTAVQAGVSKVAVGTEVVSSDPAAKDTSYVVTELDTTYYIDDDESIYAYKFIPEETGEYTINNSAINIYNMNGEIVYASNGKYSLTAGTTYILGTGYYYDYESFRVSKAETATE